jgi:hypothetical protein
VENLASGCATTGAANPGGVVGGKAAYRCSVDDVNWPFTKDYKTCPLCGQETWRVDGEQPLDAREADALIKADIERQRLQDEFEDYYAKRERQRLEQALREIPDTPAELVG